MVLSLIGIASGFVVMFGFLAGRRRRFWTILFLITTLATSVTGFGFPVEHLLPSHIVGALSLLVLAVAIVALYGLHFRDIWRGIYVVAGALALYFNVFVGVVQAFLKLPALHAVAPQQTEPPFVIAQLAVLALFVLLTVVAVKRFRAEPVARA
jgi:hypothetical protein